MNIPAKQIPPIGSKSRRPPVVIFGDNITSFSVIRGLRHLDLDMFMISDTGTGMGVHSRYIMETVVLHPDDPEYVNRLIQWIQRRFTQKPILMIAGNDDALIRLSREHQRLSEYAHPTFPAWDVVDQVINKEHAYEKARDLGVPTIDTRRINSPTALHQYLESDAKLSYPVYLKCANSRQFYGRFGLKGVLCHSDKEVRTAYERYDGFLEALLLQDYLPGDIDQISAVLLVLNPEGRTTAVAVNEKVRAAKIGGPTTLSSSLWNDRMVDHAVKLAESIGYCGFVGVQFKYDPRSGDHKFLEINGRFSVSLSLAQRCGINMAEMVYLEQTGQRAEVLAGYRRRYPDKVLLWYPLSDIRVLFQKRFYRNPGQFLRPLFGAGYVNEPFSIKDPKPMLMLYLVYPLQKLLKRSPKGLSANRRLNGQSAASY